MDSLEQVISDMDQLRNILNDLVLQDPTLADPRVLILSQYLDGKINEYNELLKKKG